MEAIAKVECCPECNGKSLFYSESNAEYNCNSCGLVIEDSMPEYTEFIKQSSGIQTKPVDGRIFKSAWLLTTKEKNLRNAGITLDSISMKLNLPSYAKEQAYQLYEEAVKRDLCIGRDNESMLYACIYNACLQNNIPKTALEIAIHTDLKVKHILNAHKILNRKFSLIAKIIEPAQLLPKYASALSLSQKCMTRAEEILEKIKNTHVCSGKNPRSVAAAVLYIATIECEEPVTQRDIANQMQVTEVTIRRRYKEILQINFSLAEK